MEESRIFLLTASSMTFHSRLRVFVSIDRRRLEALFWEIKYKDKDVHSLTVQGESLVVPRANW